MLWVFFAQILKSTSLSPALVALCLTSQSDLSRGHQPCGAHQHPPF